MTLVMGQRNRLSWDIPAADSFLLSQAIYRIPDDQYKQTYKELDELLELEPLMKKPVRNLSLGERMKCEIAAGLLHRPKVLFLDEPTLGLDPQSRNQMWTHVKKLNETDQVTVFLTTHYMDEADRVANRIAVIDHGHVVAIGSSRELKERTNTESLEDAFLALTGTTIRDESATAADAMRQIARMWRR